MATLGYKHIPKDETCRFQLIGVTKEWRPGIQSLAATTDATSFQSIGVTKEWRHVASTYQVSTAWLDVSNQ